MKTIQKSFFSFQKTSSKDTEAHKTLETQNFSQKYREQHEDLRKKIREALLSQKRSEAAAIREMREKNDSRLKQLQESTFIENQRCSTKIKAGLFQGKLKIKEFSASRSRVFKQEKVQKIKEDEVFAKRKELEAAQMELFEMQLIKELQNTHQVQRNLFEEYDSLLNENIQEFEKKFKPPEKNARILEIDAKKPVKIKKKKGKNAKSQGILSPKAMILPSPVGKNQVNGENNNNDNKEKGPESPIKENLVSSP